MGDEQLFKQNIEETKERLSAGALEIENFEQDFLSDIQRTIVDDKEQNGRLTNTKRVLDNQKQRDVVVDVSLLQEDVQRVDDIEEFLYEEKQEEISKENKEAKNENKIEEKQEVKQEIRVQLKDIRIPIEGRKSAPLIHMNTDPLLAEEKLKEKAVHGLLGQIDRYLSHQNDDVECIAKLLNTDENGSASYKQMRFAVQNMQQIARKLKKGEPVSNGVIMEGVMLLSETAQGYCDLHDSPIRLTKKGKDRRKAAYMIRRLCTLFYDKYDRLSGGKGLAIRPDKEVVIGVSPSEIKKAGKHVRELAANYDNWRKHFAHQEARERENIRDKADLFAVYERDIEIYKATRKEIDWKPEVAAIIREYEYYKLQNKLLTLAEQEKDGKQLADKHTESVKEYAEKLDERKKTEKPLPKEVVDTGLTDEQIAAVEKIDRWFIRNYNNAGLVGRLFGVRNHHGDIVSELFKKTKRERLFIYYLIETGARKSPNYIDVYKSQTVYTPNLDNFKDVMLATKLKVASHATGTYVYMHKLSEAMQINREYKDLVKDCCTVPQSDKEAVREDKKKNQNPKEVKRQDALLKFYFSTQTYRNKLIDYQNENDKKKKETIRQEAKVLADITKENLKALIDADNAFGEETIKGVDKEGKLNNIDPMQTRPDMTLQDGVDAFSQLSLVGGNALSYTPAAYNLATLGIEKLPFVNGRWHLSDSVLAHNEFYSGATGTTIAGLSQIAATAFAIWHLVENHDKMHIGDVGAGVAGILQSFGNAATTVWKGVESGNALQITQSSKKAAEVTASSGLKAAGAVTAGLGVMISSYKMTSGYLDEKNTKSAKDYLEYKHGEALSRAKNEEEKKKLDREIRYEKNIIKLSERMTDYKKKSATGQMVANSISFAGVFVPGIGSMVSIGGSILGVGLGILDVVRLGGIRDKMFDEFFDIDNLVKTELSKEEERGRTIHDEKEFRERMRRKLAASLGYADIPTACDEIARRYADFLCCRLYDKTYNISNREKNGYIQLIKSFGLPYEEDKQIPSAYLLARKMAGR